MQLVARALGGETGPSDKGWGTGPRSTPLYDEAAAQFLQECARHYDQWQHATVAGLAHSNEDVVAVNAGKATTRFVASENDELLKESLNLFYSHQDQVIRPPTVGGLR